MRGSDVDGLDKGTATLGGSEAIPLGSDSHGGRKKPPGQHVQRPLRRRPLCGALPWLGRLLALLLAIVTECVQRVARYGEAYRVGIAVDYVEAMCVLRYHEMQCVRVRRRVLWAVQLQLLPPHLLAVVVESGQCSLAAEGDGVGKCGLRLRR